MKAKYGRIIIDVEEFLMSFLVGILLSSKFFGVGYPF